MPGDQAGVAGAKWGPQIELAHKCARAAQVAGDTPAQVYGAARSSLIESGVPSAKAMVLAAQVASASMTQRLQTQRLQKGSEDMLMAVQLASATMKSRRRERSPPAPPAQPRPAPPAQPRAPEGGPP